MDFCILHLCLVPMKVRTVALDLLELESLTVVNNHVLLINTHALEEQLVLLTAEMYLGSAFLYGINSMQKIIY